jgi:hypothetical protein
LRLWNALGELRSLDPALKVERVLIVGPGLNLAPCNGLRDDTLPQSYQPYLTPDGLLNRKIADEQFLTVQTVDVNPFVVAFISEFKRSPNPRLKLPVEPGSAAYSAWFDQAGKSIGVISRTAEAQDVSVRPTLARRVSSEELNIITQRIVPTPDYDLVVVTNVLSGFGDNELSMALTNIHAMLREGGYLIHNEPRAEVAEIAGTVGLPVVVRHSVDIAPGARRELTDVYTIHRRR